MTCPRRTAISGDFRMFSRIFAFLPTTVPNRKSYPTFGPLWLTAIIPETMAKQVQKDNMRIACPPLPGALAQIHFHCPCLCRTKPWLLTLTHLNPTSAEPFPARTASTVISAACARGAFTPSNPIQRARSTLFTQAGNPACGGACAPTALHGPQRHDAPPPHSIAHGSGPARTTPYQTSGGTTRLVATATNRKTRRGSAARRPRSCERQRRCRPGNCRCLHKNAGIRAAAAHAAAHPPGHTFVRTLVHTNGPKRAHNHIGVLGHEL